MADSWSPPPQRARGGSRRDRYPGTAAGSSRFVDATQELHSLTADLALGQMVHPATFTMVDSMACISINDPRMDSGVFPPPEDLIPVADRLLLPPGSVPTYNPHRPLNLDEVTWIADRLFACEVAYHNATPLSQTLYTILYYHDIQSLNPEPPCQDDTISSAQAAHPLLTGLVLRAYLIATIKCFGLAWEEMARGNLIDGEDTITDTCNLTLLQDVPVGYALSQLDTATRWLDTAGNQHDPAMIKLIDGLQMRLKLRRHALLILSAFSEAVGGPSSTNNAAASEPMSPQLTYQQVHNLCASISSLLPRLQTDFRPVGLSSAPSLPAASSFEPTYSRRLQNAGGIPPRPVDLPATEETFAFWRRLLVDWRRAASILRIMFNDDVGKWQALSLLLATKGALYIENSPCAYMRSLFQSCLCPHARPHPAFMMDFLSTVVHTDPQHLSSCFQELSSCRPDSDYVSGLYGHDFSPATQRPLPEALEWWVNKGEGLLSEYLLTLMSNRPRAKRMLGKSFPRWRTWSREAQVLSARAVEVCGHASQRSVAFVECLADAAEYQTLLVALNLILAGFELDLYGPEEMPSAYWMGLTIATRAHAISSQAIKVAHIANAVSDGDTRPAAMARTSAALQKRDDEMHWLTASLQVWLTLSLIARAQAQSQRPSADSPHAKAAFMRRFKWLTLPSRDAHGAPQSPASELNALWEAWTREAEHVRRTFTLNCSNNGGGGGEGEGEGEGARARARAHLESAYDKLSEDVERAWTAVRKYAEGARSRVSDLCSAEATELTTRLLRSVTRIRAELWRAPPDAAADADTASAPPPPSSSPKHPADPPADLDLELRVDFSEGGPSRGPPAAPARTRTGREAASGGDAEMADARGSAGGGGAEAEGEGVGQGEGQGRCAGQGEGQGEGQRTPLEAQAQAQAQAQCRSHPWFPAVRLTWAPHPHPHPQG